MAYIPVCSKTNAARDKRRLALGMSLTPITTHSKRNNGSINYINNNIIRLSDYNFRQEINDRGLIPAIMELRITALIEKPEKRKDFIISPIVIIHGGDGITYLAFIKVSEHTITIINRVLPYGISISDPISFIVREEMRAGLPRVYSVYAKYLYREDMLYLFKSNIMPKWIKFMQNAKVVDL